MAQALNEISDKQLPKIKPFLDKAVKQIEQPSFIDRDPVSFMYAFDEMEDRVLAGFFAALMAWGRREVVLNKTEDLLQRMDHQPAQFIRSFEEKDRKRLAGWKHRTFKPVDIYWLIKSIQKVLHKFQTFKAFWRYCYKQSKTSEKHLLTVFHYEIFSFFEQIPKRTFKHIAHPGKNSACKRLCMYLRWVVRQDSAVDPGVMPFMPPSELFIPLDVHVARQARMLGLLTRTYNDWKAVAELTKRLRRLDSADPVKYDYALFGIGVDGRAVPEKFIVNQPGKLN